MRVAPIMPLEIGRAAILFPKTCQFARASVRRLQLGGIDEAAGLAPPERGIVAAAPQQLVVRTLLDDAAAVEHDQPVHARDGREPVCDGDHRLASHQRAEA